MVLFNKYSTHTRTCQTLFDAYSESSGHGLVQDGKGIEILEAVWFYFSSLLMTHDVKYM